MDDLFDCDFQTMLLKNRSYLVDIGNDFQVLASTINDWLNGKNLPCRYLQQAIFSWLYDRNYLDKQSK